MVERNDVGCEAWRSQLRWMDTKDMCHVAPNLTVPTQILSRGSLAKNNRT